MPQRTAFAHLVLSALSALCVSCASTTSNSHDAQPITQQQRWYWLGSTSYANHLRANPPSNYWLEIDGEHAVIQADCNKVQAKSMTTHEGRLWLSNLTATKVSCPAGGLGSAFTKQLNQTQITERRGSVLRISLSQYGDAMFFVLDPTAQFSSYRCEGGEPMAVIAQAQSIHLWLGDQYSHVAREHPSGLDSDDIAAATGNCRKQASSGN
jgi:hypothetical protein